MIFANTFGSLIGAFTLCVLWIPLPVLHYMGWETFELPRGEQAWMMAISVLANASKSSRNNHQHSRHSLHHHSLMMISTNTPSVLRFLPGPNLAHLPRSLLRRRTAHHIHRRHRRPTAAAAAKLAPDLGGDPRWSADHWCVSFAVVGHV
jgi:hypothetical protein